MARFVVLVRSLIGDRIAEPGAIVEIAPHTSFASANLRPLDAEAAQMRAKRDERTAESAPPGSFLAREAHRLMHADEPLSEAQIQAMHHQPRKLTPTPGGLIETSTWAEAVEASNHGAKP